MEDIVKGNENTRIDQLIDLYSDIWRWGQKYDTDVALRNIEGIDPNSQLFIVGEAYAANQVNKTGINWINLDGKLGPAGRNLEKILNCVEYTTKPPRRVRVGDSRVNPSKKQRNTAYTTDIWPCYPDKNSLPEMIIDSLTQGFLIRELEVLQPKVILLLGKKSYKAFFKHILEKEANLKISERFTRLNPQMVNQLDEYMGAIVVPFYHPSPQNGLLMSWLTNKTPLSERPQIKALRMIINNYPLNVAGN